MRWMPRWLAGRRASPGDGPECFREPPPEAPGRLVRALGAVCYLIALFTFALCLLVMFACLVSLAGGLLGG